MPDDPKSTAPVLTKGQTFFRRLFSFLILWSFILGALFSGSKVLSDIVFLLVMVVLAFSGLWEFYDMASRKDLFNYKNFGLIAGVLLMVGTFFKLTGSLGVNNSPARVNDFETSFLILFVLGLCIRQFVEKKNTAGITAISTTLFGLMYVPWLLNFIQKIYFFPNIAGNYYLLYFVLITKFSDTGAYVVGSLIGRHKMIPRISPGKTWEGFGGAVVVSTLASVAFVQIWAVKMPAMNWIHAIVLGVILSIAAVVGDLIESLFKREANLKDSGKLFPGIGGILDLLDSLLLNAPIMYIYLRHVLKTG